MAKLLYITANPKDVSESHSLSIGETFLKVYKEQNPNDEIKVLDLYKEDIPFIDVDVFSGWGKFAKNEELNQNEQNKIQRMNELVDEFLAFDRYVFVTPLWNLSFPPMLKAYIDCILIANKTFKYTEQGPIGLLKDKNKRAVHIQARGGIYSDGPGKDLEMGDKLLKSVLQFIGVDDIQTVVMEGHAFDPNKTDQIKAKAIDKAVEIAKEFSKSTLIGSK